MDLASLISEPGTRQILVGSVSFLCGAVKKSYEYYSDYCLVCSLNYRRNKNLESLSPVYGFISVMGFSSAGTGFGVYNKNVLFSNSFEAFSNLASGFIGYNAGKMSVYIIRSIYKNLKKEKD